MADVLFIKTSSLGDVIHHMPAVDRRPQGASGGGLCLARRGSLRAACAAPPRGQPSHPGRMAALAKITVCAVDHERDCAPACAPSARNDIDDVVDTQGLLRSALIARAARGRRHGYDSSSIREPLASVFYDVRYRVSRDLHAVERNRLLSGLALGYSPQGRTGFWSRPRAVFGTDRLALWTVAARHRSAGKTLA